MYIGTKKKPRQNASKFLSLRKFNIKRLSIVTRVFTAQRARKKLYNLVQNSNNYRRRRVREKK